ncbi:MAG: RNA polymerase sigma factor [Thermoleophilaceae bacterium]
MRDAEFERLYEEHASSLLSFLAYRTGDRALAEDLLADTFERVLRSRQSFDRARASEKTWIYAIAVNCLRGHHRRRQAEGRAIERAAGDVAESQPIWEERFETRDEIDRALAELSDEEREAVALRFGAGLSGPEMAAITKQPLTTVEGRVYRALRKLRELLDEKPGETGWRWTPRTEPRAGHANHGHR